MNHNPPPNHHNNQVPAVAGPQPEPRPTYLITTRPAALSSKPDALALLNAFQRRWLLALSLGVLMAGVAGGLAWLIIPRTKYMAVSTLHVSTNPKRIIFETKDSVTDYRTFQKTQSTLIKNRKVLAHALARPEIASLKAVREQADPEEWLEEHLKADFPGGSEVLQVSLSGEHAEDLAEIVNAVVKSYMTLVVEDDERPRVVRLDELRKLREKYEEQLKLKRKTLRETASAVGLSDQKALALTQQFKSEHLSQVQRDRMTAQSELLKMKAKLTVVESRQSKAPPPRDPVAAYPSAALDPADEGVAWVERDPRVMKQRDYLASLNRKYQEVTRLARQRSDPSVVRVLKQREAAERDLAGLRAAVASEYHAGRDGRGQVAGVDGREPRLSDWEEMQGQVAVLEAYTAALDKDIESLQAEVKTYNEGSLDLENEREEIAIASNVARLVGSEVESVQVELNAPQRIKLLAAAKVPNRKEDTRKMKAGAAAALGAFAFVVVGVSYREFSARRIGAVDEVVNGLGIRLVGTLPLFMRPRRGRVSKDEASERRQQSRLVESVDAMRAVILHASRSEMTRVVMITSAVQGEGKTSLACHLAGSLARAGRKTLLVDCDLRRPACHRLFDLPVSPGLCEHLRGEAGLDEVIREMPGVGLSFMPAGRSDDRALSALAQEEIRDVFTRLQTRFDFVVVDSAPVLPVADSLLVAQVADAVVFSVMREVSRLPQVYAAHERLGSLGVNILGAVVAGIPDSQRDYGYYYTNTPVHA